MKANDIAVELGALNRGSHKLGRQIEELEQLAAQLKHNMVIVGREFDSVNFERAEEVVDDAINKLRLAEDRLQSGRAFLGGLEERAEFYLRCKYIG